MLKYYEDWSRQDFIDAFINHYLRDSGWLNSIENRESVDSSGPVPWITYPALAVLAQIARPQHRVLEYGSGGSSLWWGQRVAEVVSVEHDPDWYAEVARQVKPPHAIVHQPIDAPVDAARAEAVEEFFASGLDPEPGDDAGQNLRAGRLSRPFLAYATEVLRYPPGYFDIIVVDGMARVLTAWLAARYVKPHGIVVFDNSDRDFYNNGYAALLASGFRRIDFQGPGPINPYAWCTSIFTRSLDMFNSGPTT